MEKFRTMVMVHPLKTEGRISYEANKVTRVWEFMKTCDIGDLALIMDSKLLNPIILDYLYVAVRRVEERGSIKDYHAAVIYDEMRYLMNDWDTRRMTHTAKDLKTQA